MSAEKTKPGSEFILTFEDSADRVPVLMIHGFPLNNTMWDDQIYGLADVARLITPDLRGHGLTEATDVTPYTMELLATDCVNLLDFLGYEGPVVVAGLSMGGYIALEICRRFPERVSGLILAATKASADTDEAKAGREESARVALAEGVKPVAQSLLPRLLAPSAYEDQPDLVIGLETMMLTASPQGVAGAQLAMRDRPDSRGDLQNIKVPTLVVHGLEDQLIPVSEARVMAEGIPGAELALIEGAGHMVNMEQPELFNEAVREFLEGFYEA
jgi:pimeloyl-ACP methyl ester carboxylesterase